MCFAVSLVPPIRKEARLGVPAMGNRCLPVKRPLPVHARVETIRQPANFSFFSIFSFEVSRGSKNACNQNGRVDGRQLAFPRPGSGLHMEEMIVKTLIPGRIRRRPLGARIKESQYLQDSSDGFVSRNKFSLHTHDIGTETQTYR